MTIFDAHVHLGQDLAHGYSQSRSELVSRMDDAGVETALATPFPGVTEPRRVNEELAAAIGGRILGAGIIHPGHQDAVAEIDRLANDYQMRAAVVDVEATFEYFPVHGAFSAQVEAAFDRCAAWALPVFIHAHHPLQRFLTADLAVGIDALARRYPGLPLIVNTRVPALALVLDHDNVYVESSLDSGSPVELAGLRRRIGAHRLLFASNAPVEHPLVHRMAFERSGGTETELAQMLGDAATKLFGEIPAVAGQRERQLGL
jgi:predicted TIM-barrel fold metal-dependent hydrolase